MEDADGYFSHVIPASMAVPSLTEEIAVPRDFDLGEGAVKELHMRFEELIGCCAKNVNVINSLSARLMHKDGYAWSAARDRSIDRLRTAHHEAAKILQQLGMLNIQPLPVPADLNHEIAKITGKGLLSAPPTATTSAARGASASTTTAGARGASASTTTAGANMAVPPLPEEIPVPREFDLGEGEVKALHLRFKFLMGCCARSVNVVNSLSSRLRHKESDALSAARRLKFASKKFRHVDRLCTCHEEATAILQQLCALNIRPLPLPADLNNSIARITGKGLLSAAGSPGTTAASPAWGGSSLPVATRKALLHRLRYILPSWDCKQAMCGHPKRKA